MGNYAPSFSLGVIALSLRYIYNFTILPFPDNKNHHTLTGGSELISLRE
jgi:hypothetical protein